MCLNINFNWIKKYYKELQSITTDYELEQIIQKICKCSKISLFIYMEFAFNWFVSD